MQLDIVNFDSSKKEGKLDISDSFLKVGFNESLVHQVVKAYQAGGRSGTKGQKNRAAVSGGGAKPWRQKGTGRARAGTSRSPLWVGGGRAFPGHNRDFSQKVNKKVYRLALRCIFSKLCEEGRLIIVDQVKLSEPKTKLLVDKMKAFQLTDVLIISESFDDNVFLASRNLYHAGILNVDDIDPVSLIGYKKVIISQVALKIVEERLG